jgi:hypothetical protein
MLKFSEASEAALNSLRDLGFQIRFEVKLDVFAYPAASGRIARTIYSGTAQHPKIRTRANYPSTGQTGSWAKWFSACGENPEAMVQDLLSQVIGRGLPALARL